MSRLLIALIVLVTPLAAAALADAQSLGTYRWQLQPFCNVIVVDVTQQGSLYTLNGYDDQCAAAQRAPLVGVATPNPDGSIGFGLNVVTAPGGRGVQIDARISMSSLGGSWSDSDGNSGAFAFNASTGGNPRPAPSGGSPIPSVFALRPDGGFVAGGQVNAGVIPATSIGTRMMWYPGKAAFRAGEVTGPLWDDQNIGRHSTAFGGNTLAGGEFSFATGLDAGALGFASVAMGNAVIASGSYSTAFGIQTNAAAAGSFAAGQGTRALGINSVAMNANTRAAGNNSFAAGASTDANGAQSTAFGSGTVAGGTASFAAGSNARAMGNSSVVFNNGEATVNAFGTFVFGDLSTSNRITGFIPNQFLVRAVGGVGFYTEPALRYGVELAANVGFQWISIFPTAAMHEFVSIDGEDVLARLARMPVMEWSYKGQDAAIRHVGPSPEDFHAAFGLGENARGIGMLDTDGILLAAVKALELRTRGATQKLIRENDDLRARLARLEALLAPR